MSSNSQAIKDYLTKQIFIERNIVTYRSLSRELKIHVNVAKNELATYHTLAPFESQASQSAATYLLSGEALAQHARTYDDDDVDMDEECDLNEDNDSETDGDDVSQTKVMLVNERDLEVAKTQFSRLNSIHVYSLAPSPIRDAGLLCTPTDAIRLTDGKQGSAIAAIVGKVIGKNIQIKAMAAIKGKAPAQPVAGPSKPKVMNAAIPLTKAAEKVAIKDTVKKDDVTNESKTEDAPKATGKLDFSKARAKETKKVETTESKKIETKTKQKKKEIPPTKGTKSEKASLKPNADVRGKKRKSSMVMSDSEDGGDSEASRKVRVKKRTVLSDDDEVDVPKPTRKPRKNARASEPVDSDAENDVKALMDVDDDDVLRATRDIPVTIKNDEDDVDADLDQDVEMDDDTTLKPKPKKRRERKVIPVGSNGLKKKRVVKSRMTTDVKGYMVTEDYSSYESADEDEEPALAKAKTKAKALAKVKRKEEDDSTSTPSPPKLKPTTKPKAAPTKSAKSKAAQPKQKSLANFFTTPKAKN